MYSIRETFLFQTEIYLHFVYSFVAYVAFCSCLWREDQFALFFLTRSTRTCRCHGKWSFFGSSVCLVVNNPYDLRSQIGFWIPPKKRIGDRWRFSFCHRRYKVFMLFFQQKKCLLCFLSLDLCRPFSRWASLACHVLSLFLCPSFALYSKFVHMTINLSLYFRQHGYRNNFRFPFSCLLTFQLPLLYKTPVAMRFPSKITSSCIWVAIPVHWVILHWYACGADGRSGGRTVTWLPNFLG